VDRPGLHLAVLGAATTIAQSVLLREGMAAMGGSELTWGLILAIWLSGIGIGSRLGVRWGSPTLAVRIPLVVIAAATCGVVVLRAAPAITSVAPGEAVTIAHAWWVWIVAALPAGFAGGVAFPALAAIIEGPGAASSAYAAEAAGGVVGGLLFTFAMAPFGTAVTLGASLGLTTAVAMFHTRKMVSALILVAGVVSGWLATPWLATLTWRCSDRPGELIARTETRHQRLELGDLEGTVSLYGDGALLATVPDPYDVITRLHMLMLLHPAPHRVFALGLDRLGAVDAVLHHPVERLRSVEVDPGLRNAVERWYDKRLAPGRGDRRLESSTGDPARALDDDQQWDLVLLLDADPASLRRNRTRTSEFFTKCRDSMADDGLLLVRVGVGDTYLGGAGGDLVGLLHSTLADIFPLTAAIPGETIMLVAGGRTADLSLGVSVLSSRWIERGRPDARMSEHLLPVLIDPGRTADLADFLSTAPQRVNTAMRPHAVLLVSGLSEGRGLTPILTAVRRLAKTPPPLLVGSALLIVGAMLTVAALGRGIAPVAGAVVGGSSMTWFLVLLTIWQTIRGSVFVEIGALTAAFMAGSAVGATLIRRHPRPAAALPTIVAAGCGTSLIIAAGSSFSLPIPVVLLLLVLGGGLTGAAFAGVAQLAGRGQVRRGAGVGFAADEVGAAAAALLVGVLVLPLVGAMSTLVMLGAIQLATAAILGWRNRTSGVSSRPREPIARNPGISHSKGDSRGSERRDGE